MLTNTSQRNNQLPLLEQVKKYWILFNGRTVAIYNGKYGSPSSSALYFQLSGTSGGVNYQNSAYQKIEEKGPIPQGDYSVDLSLDPSRSVTMANGETSAARGIQRMLTKDNYGNLNWGRWRARLEKSNTNTTRDNFYFHDSYKGYSHGCIETETSLYYFLYSLHAQGHKSIPVKVEYPSNNTGTNGNTGNTPFRLPVNTKKLWSRYSSLPSGDPKTIPWIPWPIDKEYRFEPTFFEVKKYK